MSGLRGSQPAGWYRDPHTPETRERYWSGKRWTALRRVAGDGTAEADERLVEADPAEHRIDNTWAWLAALSPLLIILFGLAFPDQPAMLWAPAAAGIVAGLVDVNQLAKAGREPGSLEVLAVLLLLPVYLVLRTRRTPTTPLIPVAWGVSVLVVLAIANIAA